MPSRRQRRDTCRTGLVEIVHNLAWVDSCDEDVFEEVDHYFESLIQLS